ncbi:chloride channel protein [Oceanivirga salmonicida]|uniref:chloride channel protein n=1 Tax=Oceanivirga salmonicida TaxID=1769291 RepID=UPI0012E1410C|nr:chloride channel protein [Oceanivirga salmonicida]
MFIVYTILLGIIMGIITTIFGTVLISVSNYRDMHKEIIFLLPIIGAVTYYMYSKYAPRLKKGMNLVQLSYKTENEHIDNKLIPFITISTWLTHLFGASAGREGVAVQIGASFSNMTYRKFGINKHEAMLAGMGAGFAGLFGTPLAAMIFPIEIMFNHKEKKLSYQGIFMIVFASLIASYTSSYLGLYHFKYIINEIYNFNIKTLLVVIFASLMFSIAAIIFTKTIKFLKPYLSKNIYMVFILSILLAFAIYFVDNARYAGLGTNLIYESFKNNGISINNYDFLLKIIFTCFTLSLSYQGGEVTPLFAIGASLGAMIAMYFGIPVYLLASIGYAVVFSAASNTLITPILIGYEVFGINILPYLIIASICAYFASGNNSIYPNKK